MIAASILRARPTVEHLGRFWLGLSLKRHEDAIFFSVGIGRLQVTLIALVCPHCAKWHLSGADYDPFDDRSDYCKACAEARS